MKVVSKAPTVTIELTLTELRVIRMALGVQSAAECKGWEDYQDGDDEVHSSVYSDCDNYLRRFSR